LLVLVHYFFTLYWNPIQGIFVSWVVVPRYIKF
jgi:hypothetical protein